MSILPGMNPFTPSSCYSAACCKGTEGKEKHSRPICSSYSFSQDGSQEYCFLQAWAGSKKTSRLSNAQYKVMDNTVIDAMFPPSEVMFTNDKHSRSLRPVAPDTGFFRRPHSYTRAEVLLQAPKRFLNHLFFNSPWTLSIIFPAHPWQAALPAELSWRLLVTGCQGPFGPFPREIQELLSDPSQISSRVIYEADNWLCFIPWGWDGL